MLRSCSQLEERRDSTKTDLCEMLNVLSGWDLQPVVVGGHLARSERGLDERRERLDVGTHDDDVAGLEARVRGQAVQDRVAYGPSFEVALAALLGRGASTLTAEPGTSTAAPPPSATRQAAPAQTAAPTASDANALIAGAARDLEEYQRLTAEGKLGEAGQRLEALKAKLQQLSAQQR